MSDYFTNDDADRCKCLWDQVLTLALKDLQHESWIIQRQAYGFFMSDQSSFLSVCEILDLCPFRIRKKIKEFRVKQEEAGFAYPRSRSV